MSEVPLYGLAAPAPTVFQSRICKLLHRHVQLFRGGLVFKAHRRFVSLNARLASNKDEEETTLDML